MKISLGGQMKIKAIKYISNEKQESKVISIDARSIIKAILKDALSAEIMVFDKRRDFYRQQNILLSSFLI